MTTLAALHRIARAALAEAGIADAALDARILVEELTGTTRTDLLARPEMEFAAEITEKLATALERRTAGEPVHRILGAREFYGLRLSLSPDTLEPRPDTEALVDLALPFVTSVCVERGVCRVLDLGTGTGAIPLAILSAEPRAIAVATDIAPGALETAKANAKALGLSERVEFVLSDWFGGVEGTFDLIVSNPPYIPSAEIASLAAEVRSFDPLRALDGGADGLGPYRIIARDAGGHLAPGGAVMVEIGAGQGPDVAGIFAERGFRQAGSRRDLGGHERALFFLRQ
ncbi:peptide chain release factor N(5)-glutamine methyltransferase [Mesorhizobium sp. J428]|uniref:peptide chain release factor N(5)-glutamine methyltransferase n=1 Tax=Mesorhizobium sp. J428 TaxID=2898440 RepID=UPI002151815B|nr:peptide chain release factor N(5)-glutamine methyltransferase [Mesorhizobium sp. J428]MCR5856462.1 peptide chain release factor N(5)-glutamine methyltransferase [Mesorhizobium sp. J428]